MSTHTYQPKYDYPLTRHPGKWTTQRNMRLLFYIWDNRPAEYIAKKLGFTPDEIRTKRCEILAHTQPNPTQQGDTT